MRPRGQTCIGSDFRYLARSLVATCACWVAEIAVRNDSRKDGYYRTIPICLAASSQTQIGSPSFSNFRQRRSQSIIGTKQLKLDETVWGLPFFIHTRKWARWSPSLSQDFGLRICWYSLWLCEHCLVGLSQPGLGCCKAGRATRAWS